MQAQGISEAEMARRMQTQLDRLLDPENDKVPARHHAARGRRHRAQAETGIGLATRWAGQRMRCASVRIFVPHDLTKADIMPIDVLHPELTAPVRLVA
jgi:hypothetical protein